MEEEWREVYGYEGLYEISDTGKVRSIRNTTSTYYGKILSIDSNQHGYERVTLYKNGKRKTHSVHLVLAETFIGPCPEGMQVNHKNGIKDDNRIENLEYVTPRQNLMHARNVLGKKFGNYKINKEEAREICVKYNNGNKSQKELAEEFDLHKVTISRIVHGESDHGLSRKYLSEKENRRKLNEDSVREIRNLGKRDDITQRKIAEMFGVKPCTINNIIKRRSWKHVD